MKLLLPNYTTGDYIIMLWTMVPFGIVLNILIFGKQYFSRGQFIFATLITTAASCIDFTLCGGIAVILKRRLPFDEQVKKRLAIMLFIFINPSGFFLRNFTVVLPLIWNNTRDKQFAFIQKNSRGINLN